MAAASASSKRPRNAADEPAESQETKRLRESSLIFDILDDDDDVGGAVDDLAGVIKILEDEISAPAAAAPRMDLGYLLEASDDELGIPPAGESSDVVEVSDEEPDAAGFDRIWGFEDDVSAGLDFGVMAGFDDGVDYDGSLFGYDEFPWPTESLTAV